MRLRALAAKHAAAEQAAEATPPESDPQAVPPTMEEASAVLETHLGVPAWERSFRKMTGHDGQPMWVDTDTGETFATMPALNHNDGRTD